jgi:ribosome maturation factor RimP
MADRLAGRVRDVITGPIAGAGADLEDVEIHSAGSRRVVRVVVDTDGGISMDQVAELTRLVSAALDGSDVLGERPYVLEVSSPGVSRPLTLPRHWRRNRGRLVRVLLSGHPEPLVGRIDEVTDEAATILLQDEHRTIRLAEVRRAVVQVEMDAKER